MYAAQFVFFNRETSDKPMNIDFKQIEKYLQDNSIRYSFSGKPQDSYQVASIFEPIDNGFYFFTGDKHSLGIKNSLILTSTDLHDAANLVLKIEDEPQRIYYRILNQFFGQTSTGEIATTSVIHPEAKIGKNVQIDDFCIVGRCEIGDNCIIGSHTKIHDNTTISNDVRIESNSVIGTNGVAWVWNEDGTERIVQPQLGGVMIGSNCFLGANTVIVRGSLNERTKIGKHTLIAPGSRIGHGTNIGDYVHFANNVVTGGNTKIGDYSFVGSAAVFRPRTKVHPRSIVGAGAVVVKNTTGEGYTLVGVPAKQIESKDTPSGMPKPINSTTQNLSNN